jgi:hypothetical protein
MTEIPDAAIRARQMYIDGVPVRIILGECKFGLCQLYHWLDGAPQPETCSLLPPIRRRRIIVRRSSRAATRVALITRMFRATEMQLHGIEERLAKADYKSDDGERDARAMAVLVRTLRELSTLDETIHPPPNEPSQPNDNPVPLDIDGLRRSLSRKLDALVAEQQGEISHPADG